MAADEHHSQLAVLDLVLEPGPVRGRGRIQAVLHEWQELGLLALP